MAHMIENVQNSCPHPCVRGIAHNPVQSVGQLSSLSFIHNTFDMSLCLVRLEQTITVITTTAALWWHLYHEE